MTPPRLGRGANIARVPTRFLLTRPPASALPPPSLDAEYASATRSAHDTMPCYARTCASCDQLWFAESTCPSCRAPAPPAGEASAPRRATLANPTPKPTVPETADVTPGPARTRTLRAPPGARTAGARRWRGSRGVGVVVVAGDALRRVVELEAENASLRRRLEDAEAALTAAIDPIGRF